MRKICFIFFILLVTNISLLKEGHCITIAEEEEIAREFTKAALQHVNVIKDTLIVNYVNEVGKKILAEFPPQPFTYRFSVIKEDAYNAFAAPAGNIFINTGLIEAMDSEEELAGILAHEIAHAACRHISQKIESSSKIGLATFAGLAAGIFLGIGGADAAAANAVSMSAVAAGQSLSLAYSREHERQADQLGLKYLNKAGYSGAGSLSILKKIRNKQWFGSDVIPTYITTHPALEERIGYISAWIDTQENREQGNRAQQDSGFRRAHSRILALYTDENIALKRLEAEFKKNPEDATANYGYGLILSKTGKREQAIFHFKKALEKRMFDSYILKDLGIAYFSDGRYAEALKTLEGSVSMESEDPEGMFFLGRTQMEMKKFEAAVATFKDLTEKHPNYKQAFYYLGEACGRQDNLEDAHYYLGIYYNDRKDFKNAGFHLEKALTYTKDQGRKLKIEEMLKHLKMERKQSEEELKKKSPTGQLNFFAL
jgi:predicted Zn-dependent protease